MRITRTVKAVAGVVAKPAVQAVFCTLVAGTAGVASAADLEPAAQQPVVSGMVASPAEGPKPHYREVNGKSVYIVRLKSPSVAAYRGGIKRLAATSPAATGARRLDTNSTASRAYAGMLAKEQGAFLQAAAKAAGRALRPRFTYRYAFNGVALNLTRDEAAAIAKLSAVRSIERERFEVLLTDDGPDWIGAPAIWEGDPGSLGEGAVVGVLDSGINFDHPSFADVAGDGYDHTNPLGSGNYLPGSYCDTVDPSFCNDKLIGAWDMVQSPGEDPGAPNDSDGHGSHTASTAAGNVLPDATLVAPTDSITRPISGVAPRANIIAYDVCIDSCPGSALVAAMDQIIIDASALPNGIQALNYSISGGNNPYNDAVEIAFLNANIAGIYPAVSAGNSGPTPATTGHNSPWVSATAASTHRRSLGGTILDLSSDGGALPDLVGATFSAGYGPAAIVHALDYPTDNGSANDSQPDQCLDPFPAGTWDGEIVVCDRGEIARVDKGANVLAGGAGGYVLANLDAQGEDVVADGHFLPAVHIGDTAGDALREWLAANDNTVATLSGTEINIDEANADIMAGFSSRGPNSSIEVIKPDVTAPGASIWAAINDGAAPAPEFGFLSGTSMSGPHQAGAAALVMHLTDWTASEAKSAIMMTAVRPTELLKEDGVTPADPFDVGAGRVDMTRVLDAGLVLDETQANYEAANPDLGGDPKTLNLASMANHACVLNCSWARTVRNVTGAAGDWTLSVADSNGVTFSVVPEVLSLADGEEGSLTVTADTTLAGGGFAFSYLDLEPADAGLPSLHMPIAVQGSGGTNLDLMAKSVDLAEAGPGDVLNYQVSMTNGPLADEITIVDEMPAGVSYIEGSALAVVTNGTETSPVQVVGDTLSWSGNLDVGGITVQDNGLISGYIGLAGIGVAPITLPSNPDDGGLIIDVEPFNYNGETYTQVIWSVNGTLEAGTASGVASSFANQNLPDPTAPNNILAPFWTDLNMTFSGNAYAAILTDGTNFYNVFEWEDVPLFGDEANTYSFQVWMLVGTDLIWYTYGNVSTTDINVTVGAENGQGTSGSSWFYNGDGQPPMVGQDLQVVATQGGTVTLDFAGQVDACEGDAIVNQADMTSGDASEFALAITSCSAQEIVGDVTGDGVVDMDDVDEVNAALGQPADGDNDPRDMDDDGMITVADARRVVLACDLPRCARP